MTTSQILNIKEKIHTDESISSFEYHEYTAQTGVNLNNQGEIRIVIENQDQFFLPSQGYLQIEGQLQKADDTLYVDGDVITLTNNAIMYLFSNVRYTLSGQEIESINHPGQCSTMLGLLTYPDDFSKSSGINQLWYKDTGAAADLGANLGFAARHGYIIRSSTPKGMFSFCIPLKHIYGFCDDYTRIIYGLKHELTLNRKDDNDAIFRAAGVDPGRINLNKCSLYIPIVMPNDLEKLDLYKIIDSKTSIDVGYRMRQCDTINVPQNTTFSWRLSVKASPEKPRWVILGFQTGKDGQEENPAIFDNCNLVNGYVMLNSTRYPVVDYQLDFAKQQFSRMYKESADFRKNYYGMDELISNSNINPMDFKNLYSLYVFDVSKQTERVKHGITDITIKANFSVPVPANTTAYAVVISDRIVKFQSDGSRMAVVY